MQLEIPSADELTAQAFRFRKEDKYAAHPIEAALRYHLSQAEKSGAESHGGFDFESAEVLYRASAEGLRLSEIPQLPQSLAELSRLGALDRAARLGLAPEHRKPRHIPENLTASRPAMKTAHQRIQEISEVMKRAVEKAAEKHRLMGVPMVVWKDGKVVEFLPPPLARRTTHWRLKITHR